MMDKEISRHYAREILRAIDSNETQDFHTLSSEKVEILLTWADAQKYRKPKNANGSRARYYFARLQRLAK